MKNVKLYKVQDTDEHDYICCECHVYKSKNKTIEMYCVDLFYTDYPPYFCRKCLESLEIEISKVTSK